MKNVIQFMMLCILVIGGFSFGTTYAQLSHQPKEEKELVKTIHLEPTVILTSEIEKQSPIVHQSNAHELDVARQSLVFTCVILPHKFARSQTQDNAYNYKVSDRPEYEQNSTNTILERYYKARYLDVVSPYNIGNHSATANAPDLVGKARYLDVVNPYNISANAPNINRAKCGVFDSNLWADSPNI